MADAELERLRAEVRKLRTRATKKAARLRRDKGVQIAGSKYDPRRAVGSEKRLNKRQLQSYVGRLQGFNSRSTQYGAIGQGVPVPQKKLDRYHAAQARFNRSRGFLGRRVAGVRLAGNKTTITESSNFMVAGRRGYQSNSLLARANLPASNIVDERSLDRFTRTFDERASLRGQRADLRKARFNLDRMAQFTQDGERLRDKFSGMSDDQIIALYSDNQFMNHMAMIIDSDQNRSQQDMPEDQLEQETLLTNEAIDRVLEAV